MSEEKKNVPKLRFPGFTEEWEKSKAGDIFAELQNNSLARADLSMEQGKAKNVHYGDILVKFGEMRRRNMPSNQVRDISSMRPCHGFWFVASNSAG